jgi:hypothetical protein
MKLLLDTTWPSFLTLMIASAGLSVENTDPQDSHVFGPPGFGSISQRYRSGSFPY